MNRNEYLVSSHEQRLNSIEPLVRAMDATLGTSISPSVQSHDIEIKALSKSNEVTQKLLEQLIQEIKDYKEEDDRLSKQVDELSRQVEELKERVESVPMIDFSKWTKEHPEHGDVYKQLPTVWMPDNIEFVNPHDDNRPYTNWKVTCKAETEGEFTLPDDKPKTKITNNDNTLFTDNPFIKKVKGTANVTPIFKTQDIETLPF